MINKVTQQAFIDDVFARVNAACEAVNMCNYPVPTGMTMGHAHLIMAESIKTINRLQEMGRRISVSLEE